VQAHTRKAARATGLWRPEPALSHSRHRGCAAFSSKCGATHISHCPLIAMPLLVHHCLLTSLARHANQTCLFTANLHTKGHSTAPPVNNAVAVQLCQNKRIKILLVVDVSKIRMENLLPRKTRSRKCGGRTLTTC